MQPKIKQNNKCGVLHKLFHQLQRHSFPFENNICDNGIYVLFEKGELAHGGDRIVRIGTHTGKRQLKSRLKQHFVMENKDRSIFRKNIGRAILNKTGDPFLEQWEWDLTTRQSKEKYDHLVNKNKKEKLEKEVSKYIQSNLSFIVFGVEDKNERLTLESRIISTVSLCNECKPSNKWLGLKSPKKKIRESGLWLVNELYKQEINEAELKRLYELCKNG